MSANELKKELVSYIQNTNDEQLLSLLKEDFFCYGKVKDTDITDDLNEDQLEDLRTLARRRRVKRHPITG